MEAGTALAHGAVSPLPGTAATAVAFRAEGRLHVTVIAKATFVLTPDAPMTRTAPQEIVRGEVHHRNNPTRSVVLTTDLAPRLLSCDVVFTGHAFSPPGRPGRILPVRLAVFDGLRPLLDKRLLVEDEVAFERMPIVYERAAPGEDPQDNPAASGKEPNIVDPARPDHPGGFGPISRAWPARRRLLGATPRRALELPIAEIPDGFDWSYFQAAPADQRTELLRGDEWLLLEGLHPTAPILRTGLPGARGQALVYGASASGIPEGGLLELRADTLRIDGDEQRCTLVFRQSFPVAGEAVLAALRVVAGVTIHGEPSLPDTLAHDTIAAIEDPPTEQLESWHMPSPRALAAGERASFVLGATPLARSGDAPDAATPAVPAPPPGTLASMSDTPAPATPALPFQAPVPGAPPSLPAAPAARRPRGRTGTIVISADEPAPDPVPTAPTPRGRTATMVLSADAKPPARPALPFVEADEPDPDQEPTRQFRVDVAGLRAQFAEGAPFPLAAPGSAPAAPGAPIPGAPWSAVPAERPPSDEGLFQTLPFVESLPAWTTVEPPTPPRARSIGEMALSGTGFAVPPSPRSPPPLDPAPLDPAPLDPAPLDPAPSPPPDPRSREGVAASLAAGEPFSGRDMCGLDLSGLDFTGRVLDGAKLRGATLTGAVFVRASLVDVDLQRAAGEGVDLRDANLERADMQKARLVRSSFDGASLQSAVAGKADLTGSCFVRADLRGASLRGATLRGAAFEDARLDDADLRNADLEGATGADLHRTRPRG